VTQETTQVRNSERSQWQRKDRARRVLTKLPSYLILSLWAAFTIFVILWVIISSFKSNSEVFRDVFNFPKSWQFENYVKAWKSSNFGVYFKNSVIYTLLSTLGILLVSSPAAYALTRLKFKGQKFLLSTFVAGMGIPFSLVIIPLFVIMTRLGLISTTPGLVIIYISLSIPFTVYLLTGFYYSLPKELEEAACLDGCNDFQVFRYVMMPLTSPGLITAAIFNGIGLWNEYQLVLVFMGDSTKRNLALGLYSMQNAMEYTGNWVGLFAGVCIIMIPTILLYIFLSEKMISGITMGAVK
jgi:N-acetylglucosamine transport system permease protein